MEFHALPQPEEISLREREDAMGAYFMMFASLAAGLPLPFINILASIIYYYVNKKTGRFVQFHSIQALIAHIPVAILNTIIVIWGFLIMFYDYYMNVNFKAFATMAITANLVYIVFSVIAAIKAHKGHFYYFWFFGKLAYISIFKVKNDTINEGPVNRAPL